MYKQQIKKVMCIGILALMPTFMLADEDNNGSGFFAGINTGYTARFQDIVTTEQQNKSTTESSVSAPSYINIGVQLGYNYYFMELLGVRGYVDYNFGFMHNHTKSTEAQKPTTDSNALQTAHAISANIDLLVNIFKSDSVAFGAYVGFGLGYAAISNTNTKNKDNAVTTITTPMGNGFILPINFGLNLTANSHHRFELGFKIPTLSIKHTATTPGENNTTTTTTRNLITTIGYTYVF